MATAHDECVVDAAPLTEILGSFIDRWERDRPSPPTRYGRTGSVVPAAPAFVDPVTWLASESGLPEKTIRNLTRVGADGTRRPRYRTTELRIADALVCAIGYPDALSEGGPLQARGRHPSADGRCCTGSLNGSMT